MVPVGQVVTRVILRDRKCDKTGQVGQERTKVKKVINSFDTESTWCTIQRTIFPRTKKMKVTENNNRAMTATTHQYNCTQQPHNVFAAQNITTRTRQPAPESSTNNNTVPTAMSRTEAASSFNSSYVQDEEENPNKKSVLFATIKSPSVVGNVYAGVSNDEVETGAVLDSEAKVMESRPKPVDIILRRLREAREKQVRDKIDYEHSDNEESGNEDLNDELLEDDSIEQEAIELEIEREATEREVEELLYEKDNARNEYTLCISVCINHINPANTF
mgnify:CR=1 FL=1